MLIKSLLFAGPLAAYTPAKDYSYEDELFGRGVKSTKCAALTAMSFWSPGHAVDSCTNADNFKSICDIKCDAPYVSLSKTKPHDPWEVQCKGSPATWKSTWKDRPNNDCFFCPDAAIQTKGARLLGGWTDGNGKTIGNEIRIKFDTASLQDTCNEGFVFSLEFKTFALPEDVVIDIPGATVTYISPDRHVVTVEPNEDYSSWTHDFWTTAGTRAYIYASNLNDLKGQWSVNLHVLCQDFGSLGQRVSDLSCMDKPGDIGTPYTNGATSDCPTTTTTTTTMQTNPTIVITTPTVATTTTQQTNPTIVITTPSVATPTTQSTTTKVTTTKTTTTTRTPFVPNNCVLHGSHSLGQSPNWWQSGNTWSYQAYVTVPISETVQGGWSVEIEFKKPMTNIQFWSGTVQKIDNQGYVWKFTGNTQTYNDQIHFTYIGDGVPTEGGNGPIDGWGGAQQIIYCNEDGANPGTTQSPNPGTTQGGGGGTTQAPTTQTATTGGEPMPTSIPGCVDTLPNGWQNSRCHSSFQQGYCVANPAQASPSYKSGATDYEKLLHLSILFYEAQRSGPLPAGNRVPWRGQSALKDGCDVGHDLTGGWYDAGDFVKFNFPMAYSVTTIAWGMISFEDGYRTAGEWDRAVDSIKWVTDYLIKCHTSKFEFYGQCANGGVDHSYWGRPEEYPHDRPSYKIDQSNPGSDLAGEASAALSAASIVFGLAGMTSAKNEALSHSRELFEFADQYRGTYTSGIPDASTYYNSWSGYQDELIWAAAWLAKASGKASDRTIAESRYNSLNGAAREDYSWDNKKMGAQIVLYEITGKASYKTTVQNNVNQMKSSGPYTPGGMIYKQQWGPARHAANAAFIALQAAKSNINKAANIDFAKSQVDYLKGGNPQNQCFIIGFANNCPEKPHHRSSSCPASGSCGWDAYNSGGPNPMVLYGALVGGPNQNDVYVDDRGDYIANEVATDYNAGWQGALAGLIQLA